MNTLFFFIRDTDILKNKVSVRYEILTVMLLRIHVFLDMRLCRWVSSALGGHVHLNYNAKS
jgi:hypothetical protein